MAHTLSVLVFFYIANQKPMIPRSDFNCKSTSVALLGEIRQCICVFCYSVFASQMALSFNMNIIIVVVYQPQL